MLRYVPLFSIVLVLLSLFPLPAIGQMVGSRGGADQPMFGGMGMPAPDDAAALPTLDPVVAEGYITIEGRAEVRVRPTDVRMVLAVTSEAETAQKCKQLIDAEIGRLKGAWSKMWIGPERIVVDFIAVLPRYEFAPEKHDYQSLEVEKKVGYRMQSNVLMAAQGEPEARAAVGVALEQGFTDIIAFDYWSKDLDDVKVKVRQQALKAARGKADVLLTALLGNLPPAINIQEHTTVRYPESLYHSFTNVASQVVNGENPFTRRDVPFIKAYRSRFATKSAAPKSRSFPRFPATA